MLSPLGVLRGDVGRASSSPPARASKPMIQGMDGQLVRYWQARRQLQRTGSKSFRDVFARVRLVAQLEKHHRELRSLARARKRQQLLEILDSAELAAQKGDSRGVYQCVRWLAPRGASKSIRLRDSNGHLMHPREECLMLTEYAKELFKARSPEDEVHITLLPLSPEIFELGKWERALCQLRAGKAVPAEPAINAWKEAIGFAAARLRQIPIDALCSPIPHVPSEWSQLQFAWLAKAGKSPSTPANLRSVGLMPGDTKAFLMVLRDAAAPPILQAMAGILQYAYRPGSSTSDALLRASSHCSAVRDLLSKHRCDLTSKLLGHANAPLIGGMMVSLRKAFDSVSHKELHRSMLEASVPDALAGVLMQIHIQTQCTIFVMAVKHAHSQCL